MPVYRESKAEPAAFTVGERNRQTICQAVSMQGVALFSGDLVRVLFLPTKRQGIYFRRVDLPGKPYLKASIENLIATPRCTIIGEGLVRVQCVEHVLSAVAALSIDDLIIELDGNEPPIFDGSSSKFVQMLESAGVQSVDRMQQVFYLQEPVYVDEGGSQMIALPSKSLKFSCTIAYPGQEILSAQFYSLELTKESYIRDIAPCRTFALAQEVKELVHKGILKSASLEHGVVIDGSKILNPEGLRFSNEMVRHKILDMIGDFALIGAPVCAHFIAICSGHALNAKLSKLLYAHLMEN